MKDFSFALILCHFIVLPLVFGFEVSTSTSISTIRNIKPEQWKYYLRQVRNYTTLVTRISSSASSVGSTFVTFDYTTPTTFQDQVVLTTNYASDTWNADGSVQQTFLYKNAKPLPIFGTIVDEKGMITDINPSLFISFYPRNYGFLTTYNLSNTGLYAIEKNIIHPFDKKVKLSIVPIYIDGNFLRVTFFRFQSGVSSFGKGFFSKQVSGKLVTTDRSSSLKGYWTSIERCIKPSYDFTKIIEVRFNPFWQFPIDTEKYIAIQLPDNVFVSFPKTVSPSIVKKDPTVFRGEWVLDFRTVIRSETLYDGFGRLVKDCTTAYYRIV